VYITDPLVADGGFITCNYSYLVIADDINNLGKSAVVNVTAKDEYDYQVVASYTEAVSLSQVNDARSIRT